MIGWMPELWEHHASTSGWGIISGLEFGSDGEIVRVMTGSIDGRLLGTCTVDIPAGLTGKDISTEEFFLPEPPPHIHDPLPLRWAVRYALQQEKAQQTMRQAL